MEKENSETNRKNEADSLAKKICEDILTKEDLENLTFQEYLDAAKSKVFIGQSNENLKKIYDLLIHKASTTEDFVKIYKTENLSFRKRESWLRAENKAATSWDFYVLYSYGKNKEEASDDFFKKMQDNLKNFQEVEKILQYDEEKNLDKPFSPLTPYQKIKLVEPVKRFAKTFDDYYLIFSNKTRPFEERKYFFNKMKNSFQTIEEAKILLSYSHTICKKKERIEILKLAAEIANEDELNINDWRERKIIRNIRNGEEKIKKSFLLITTIIFILLTISGILFLFKINLLPQESLLKIGLTVAPIVALVLFFVIFLLSTKIKYTKTKNGKEFYLKIRSILYSISFFVIGISFFAFGLLFFNGDLFAKNLGIISASFFMVFGIFMLAFGMASVLPKITKKNNF